MSDFVTRHLMRLQDPEYASIYLKTALEDFNRDGDLEGLYIVIGDLLKAKEKHNEYSSSSTDL